VVATRRRGRWIRLPLGSAISYALVTSVVVAFAVGKALAIWVAATILVLIAILLFVPIRGRVILLEWPAVVWAFLRRRRQALPPVLPAAVDINVISGEAGIRWDGDTLVAAVEVAPNLALTREASGHSQTESVLPLALVASLMTQYGLVIDIDVVSSGRHVPPGSAYRTVYSQFVGPRPLVGQRRTWLVLRLNAIVNLDGIVERGPSRVAGPKALAAAAHRVAQRLQQERIRAAALSADELDAMARAILEPVGASENREKWSVVRSGPNFITTYIGHAGMLADGQLDRWWSWRTEDQVTTIRLTGAGTPGGIDDIQVGVAVRYVHHGKAHRPLPEAKLALPTGTQRELLEAALPGGDRSLAAVMPTTNFSAVASVAVPIGPSGQILGQLEDGTLVAVPLWDQSGNPKRQRIDANVGVEVAHQLVLRAVVGTGAVVAIHTDDRQRWEGLVATVNDEQQLFYATAGARHCDIAVFDGRTVTTVPARTVLRLLGPGSIAGGADMTITEGAGQVLEVAIAGAAPVTLWAIRTREEDRYLGLGYNEMAPRRVVSTAPAVTRTPRRATAPAPVEPPWPAEPRRVVRASSNGEPVPVAAEPVGALPGQPPAAAQTWGTGTPGGVANGNGDRGGRHRDLGGPQRTPRPQRATTTPPAAEPRRPRRDFKLPPPPDHPHPPR
jgi:type VII secretion protein EccE